MRGIGDRKSQSGRWSLARACWAVLLLLISMAVLVWFIQVRSTERSLAVELAAIKARREPLTLPEAAPQVPAGKANAADSYDLAFGFLPLDVDQQFDRLMADEPFARSFCADNATVFELVEQAAATDACAFPRDWSVPPLSLTFPEYGKMRNIARMLVVRSNLRANVSKGDAALDDLRITFRVGNDVQSDPTLIGILVGHAIIGMGTSGLEAALAKSDPSPAACRRFFDDLGRIDVRTPFHRALLGERTMGIEMFEDVRSGRISLFESAETGKQVSPRGNVPSPTSRSLFLVDGFALRALLDADELDFLRKMSRALSDCSLPWSESHDRFHALDREPGGGLITAMILPVFERANWSVNRAAANIALARAAVAVKAYRAQRGRYPQSLDEVKADGWDLPLDPFNGKPLHYRHTVASFTLWSVGPNMKDDNATEYSPKMMDSITGAYDVTLICDFSRAKRKDAEHLQAWEEAKQAAEQERLQTRQRKAQGSPPGGRDGRGTGRGRHFLRARSR